MSDDNEEDETDFSLADNQVSPGVSFSRGRIFKPVYKVAQTEPNRLQQIASETMKVALIMETVEEAMTERLDFLNGSRSRFIDDEPHLFLSLSDCHWHRSGMTLTLTHIRAADEGLPSLSINLNGVAQIKWADALLAKVSPVCPPKQAAIKTAIELASLEANNSTSKETK